MCTALRRAAAGGLPCTDYLRRPLAIPGFIVATDFFSHFVQDERAMEADLPVLEKYLALRPAYVLINETSYSPRWEKIVGKCQEYAGL